LTTAIDFSQFSLQDLLALDLSKMDASDLEAFDEALEEMQARETAALARQSLLEFCLRMNPDFTDEQLAAIMTYIRNAWGNGAPPISTEAVARYRESFAPRAPWTPEELLRIK
jgi:hypothetical protein